MLEYVFVSFFLLHFSTELNLHIIQKKRRKKNQKHDVCIFIYYNFYTWPLPILYCTYMYRTHTHTLLRLPYFVHIYQFRYSFSNVVYFGIYIIIHTFTDATGITEIKENMKMKKYWEKQAADNKSVKQQIAEEKKKKLRNKQ